MGVRSGWVRCAGRPRPPRHAGAGRRRIVNPIWIYMIYFLALLGQGFDFRFWSALDADWWENEPVKTGLDGAGRGQK